MSDAETASLEETTPRGGEDHHKDKDHKKKKSNHHNNNNHKEQQHVSVIEGDEGDENKVSGSTSSPTKGGEKRDLSKSKDKHSTKKHKKNKAAASGAGAGAGVSSSGSHKPLKKSSHNDKGKEKEEEKDGANGESSSSSSAAATNNFSTVNMEEDFNDMRSKFEEKNNSFPSNEMYESIDTDEGRKKLAFEYVFNAEQWLNHWNHLKKDEKLPEIDFAITEKPKEEGHDAAASGEKQKGPTEEQILETAKSQSKICQMRKVIDLGTKEAIETGTYTLEDKKTHVSLSQSTNNNNTTINNKSKSKKKIKDSSDGSKSEIPTSTPTTNSNRELTYFLNDHKFPPVTCHENSIVHVVEEDAIETAIWMKYESKEKYEPIVLNLAHKSKHGGGYKDGTRGFEEELWRRSNIRQYLNSTSNSIPEFGGIYVPNVTIFRSSEETGYQFLNEPKEISFFNAYSYLSPKMVEVMHGKGNDAKGTGKFEIDSNAAKSIKRKMRTVLLAGLELKYNVIILSAWGCGKHKSSPGEMAKLWQEVILEDFKDKEKPEGAFRKIVFAIKEPTEGRSNHNPEGNFEPFKHLWQQGKPELTIKCLVQ